MKKLSKQDLIDNAREYYEKGKLGAQDPDVENCEYISENGFRCAIGASLNEGQIKEVLNNEWNGQSVETLIEKEVFKTSAPVFAKKLQYAHDNWVGDCVYYVTEEEAKYAKGKLEAEFRKLIGLD